MFIVGIHLLVGLIVFLFITWSERYNKYMELKDEKIANGDLGSSMIRSQTISIGESYKRLVVLIFLQIILRTRIIKNCSIRSVGNGISIEKSRPPAMNSLIACNSYKSQAWPKREANGLPLGPYSYSYGAVDFRKCNAPTLEGIA